MTTAKTSLPDPDDLDFYCELCSCSIYCVDDECPCECHGSDDEDD